MRTTQNTKRAAGVRVWAIAGACVLGGPLGVVGLGGCVATEKKTPQKFEPPTLMSWEEFEPATREGVWLAGQPGEGALDRFAEEGNGGLVVNLRTDEEMAMLPYYERSVSARGVRYARIPTSGSTLGAETVEAYREAVRGHDGPVLLHCASGGRATYLWAMVRMEEEGLSAEEAIAWAEGVRGKPWEKGAEILRGYGEGEREDR